MLYSSFYPRRHVQPWCWETSALRWPAASSIWTSTDCDTGEDLDHELQILTTGDQVLMSLFVDSFKPITGAQSALIEANAPKRMMIIRLDTDTPAPVHTCWTQTQIIYAWTHSLTCHADEYLDTRLPCILTSRIEHLLKLLQTPSHENLAHVLLFPVVRKQQVSDGVQEVGPVTSAPPCRCLKMRSCWFRRLVSEAGHRQELTCLSEDMFTKALDFSPEFFEENFMENAKLKARICDLVERASRTQPQDETKNSQ